MGAVSGCTHVCPRTGRGAGAWQAGGGGGGLQRALSVTAKISGSANVYGGYCEESCEAWECQSDWLSGRRLRLSSLTRMGGAQHTARRKGERTNQSPVKGTLVFREEVVDRRSRREEDR